MLICLDPGHGGQDPGAVSPGGLAEKDVNLNIALKIRQYLTRRGIGVELARDSDISLSLEQRAAMANAWESDLFLSIHCNSAAEPSAQGIEVWYPNNIDNQARSWEAGAALAYMLDRHVRVTSGAEDRGCKFKTDERQEFYVLRKTRMPAALIECGFLSHPVEAARLADEAYLEKIALGIVNAVVDFGRLPI